MCAAGAQIMRAADCKKLVGKARKGFFDSLKGPARSAGPWGFALQLRIAEAVDQGVDFLPSLAVGALPVVVAGVAG